MLQNFLTPDDPLNLDNIRGTLIRLEDSIIFGEFVASPESDVQVVRSDSSLNPYSFLQPHPHLHLHIIHSIGVGDETNL